MNERIKLLDQQAVDYANNVCDANGIYKGKEYLTVVKEKFAELIVKEMVDECAKVCVQHAGWTPDMIAKQVKQHFGVEE